MKLTQAMQRALVAVREGRMSEVSTNSLAALIRRGFVVIEQGEGKRVYRVVEQAKEVRS